MTDGVVERLSAALGGAYTIERELGGGGMSRVFLARENALDRTVVVKVIAPELREGLSAERFAREVQVAARLQQANIVPLLSAGDASGMAYYTMPYVDGQSLRARLGRGPVQVGEALDILRDVARALAYAHGRGIVHRDIKPENVLLSSGTAVVTDFGIARALTESRTENGAAPTLTAAGTSIGTPAYMAPEQALGDANAVVTRLSAVVTPAARSVGSNAPVADRRRRRVRIGVAAALALVVAAATLLLRGRPSVSTRTVVVVPFDNIGDPADAYFADGVSEEIAGQLARLPGIAVIGREGVQRFRGSRQSPREIARELGAAYVLSGSVNWARKTAGVDGDTRVRIVPAFVEVASGQQKWREPFEERLTDVFKVEASVAEQVASALSVTLGVETRQTLRRVDSNDAEARDAQLLGRYLLKQRGRENLRSAATAFSRAIARDSGYARAWAGLAEATALRLAFNDTTESVDVVLARAQQAAERAVALDSTLPDVQLALARTRSTQFRFREALAAVDRALALDPNSTLAHTLRYEVLTALGRHDEAGAAARRAVELDPLSPLAVNNRAIWFYSEGMLDSAIHYSERAVALTPTELLWRRSLGMLYASAGRLADGVAMCATVLGPGNQCATLLPAFAGDTANRAAVLATLGSMQRLPGATSVPVFAALGYARLGMADSVFSRLRAAVELHDDSFTHLITNKAFEPYESDPRWDAIVGEVRRR